MPGRHARLAPSDSPRWMTAGCELAIHLDDQLRNRNDGELPPDGEDFSIEQMFEMIEHLSIGAADEIPASAKGTFAHAYAAQQISGVPEGETAIEDRDVICVGGEDLMKNVDRYIDLMRLEIVGLEPHVEWGTERKVELWYEPASRGAIDFWAFDPELQALFVTDYKSGGWAVDAENNSQLMIYAIALIEELGLFGYEIRNLTLAIIQPARSYSPKLWHPTWDEVAQWRDKINQRARIHQNPIGTPKGTITENGCKWCRHRSECPALLEETRDLMGLWSPEDLTDQAISDLQEKKAPLIDFLNSCEERLRLGIERFPEWQEKQGSRRMKWEHIGHAAKKMLEYDIDPMEQKPKSPATVRKELDDPIKWTEIEEAVVNVTHDKGKLVKL